MTITALPIHIIRHRDGFWWDTGTAAWGLNDASLQRWLAVRGATEDTLTIEDRP